MSWKMETFGSLLIESKIPSRNPDSKKRIRVRLNVKGVEKRPEANDKKGATKQYIRRANQFIYGKQNFHKGAFGIIPIELDGYETSADIPSFDVREDCLPEWIYYYFKAGNRYLELVKYARGVGSKRIHPRQIEQLKIPLPPIEVQKEIIEELKIIEKNSLSTELTHQLDLVKQLRQAFLREAMQGKLTENCREQNKNIEPASELLAKIKAEKEQLIKEKKIKKQKPLPPITKEDIPFQIPENWTWCRLGEIINLKSGRDLKPNQYSDTDDSGIPYITGASNLDKEKVIVSRWTTEPKAIAFKGALLLTCKGSGLGKMAWLDIDKAHIARQIMAIFSIFAELKYVKIILSQNVLSYKSKAKSLIPGIDRDTVITTLIPLPPLEEQKTIVEKLDKLMKYCDQLEESIKNSQTQNELLLQQVLKEALEPKMEMATK